MNKGDLIDSLQTDNSPVSVKERTMIDALYPPLLDIKKPECDQPIPKKNNLIFCLVTTLLFIGLNIPSIDTFIRVDTLYKNLIKSVMFFVLMYILGMVL